jgi:fructokinase
MAQIVTLGEILVEMVALHPDQGFRAPGTFAGPYPSGAPAIFIDQAARMGAGAALIGCVGEDEFGLCVLDRLEQDGVDTAAVRRVPDLATGVAFVSYRSDGSRSFIFHMGNSAAGRLGEADLTSASFAGCEVLHMMGSSLASPAMAAVARRALVLAAEAGARFSFDPNIRAELFGRPGTAELLADLTARADLLLPSEADLPYLRPGMDEEAAVRDLLAQGRAHCVLLKRGAAGSTYYDRTQRIDVPAFRVEEVDPTGAGDCAGATFVACLLQGRPPGEAARRANAAGALAVTKRGPMEGNSTVADLDDFLRKAA